MTTPQRWKCANCGATLAEQSLGRGSFLRIRCPHCRFWNSVAVDAKGERVITCLPKPWDPPVEGPATAVS